CGEGTGSNPQKRTLFHNDGHGGLTEATGAGSIDSDSDFDQGCAWEDFDNDGYLDLVISSGGSAGARNLSLYHNNGDGTFTRVTTGALVNTPGDGGGLAWADVNNDGFPDLFAANYQQWAAAPNALWLNKGNSNNWLTISCSGVTSNRAAIGAKVRVHATIGGKAMWQLRVIGTGAGYASQNELRAHFGLGDATVADQVTIEWPSGVAQTLTNVAAKQFLSVTESSSVPLSATSQPSSQTVASGSTVVFSFGVGGSPAPSYQWLINGSALSDGGGVQGSSSSTLIVGGAMEANAGTYTCVATGSGATLTSSAATLSVVAATDPGRLVNISCRAMVGTGSGALIAGFVLGGGASGNDTLLIRASGPALIPFNVSGTLPDPQLQLNDAAGLLASDTGWAGNSQVSSLASAVNAFAWTNPSSRDSALVEPLTDGSYTAVVTGSSGDTGVALAEVYDTTTPGSYSPSSPRLTNISARVQVGTGANSLIAGFVIGGSTAKTVLIRASGPALVPFNVSGVLPDPQLQLNSTAGLIASNLSWAGNPQIASVAHSVNAFSWANSSSHDAALLVTLPPGAYTAQVSGTSGDTGVALVEVYDVP
ncbi:MAG TPA: ASPIC/UnbV domain-containing protein, partial [Opitutaceae bacterium]